MRPWPLKRGGQGYSPLVQQHRLALLDEGQQRLVDRGFAGRGFWLARTGGRFEAAGVGVLGAVKLHPEAAAGDQLETELSKLLTEIC